MDLTVQNVYGLLLRSKLLSADEAKTMYARWNEEAKDNATNLSRFAAWLVSHKLVTDYQASLLVRGHADGFFLNEYKILDRLGKGRMAGVYKAQHRLGQVFAIKVLPPSRAADPNLLGRFQREAKLAMRLKHPNIVRTFQVGQAGDIHYLVMEYLEGETMEDVLARRKKLSPAEAVRLVFQALQGLQHIHLQGLVHRDLKPANLMLIGGAADSTARATVKLLDIGLGRIFFEEAGAASAEADALTGEGVLLGTPDYMSPEQARDPRVADIRSDIYSLGCVLYHALAGKPPFPDTNIISQMIRHATEPPRPLKEHNPAVPDGLQQIVNWMLAKDPGGRYPTPERAAQALEVFLAAGAEALQAPEADPKMGSYLSWLQEEGGKNPEPAASVPTVLAIDLPPVPPARPTSEAAPKRQAEAKPRPKQKPRSQPALAAVKPPSGAAIPVIDVELAPSPAPPPLFGLPLTRRDFVFFGVGAGVGALAAFLGCLIAVFGRRAPPPAPPQVKKENEESAHAVSG